MPWKPKNYKKPIPKSKDARLNPSKRGYDWNWTRLSRAYRKIYPLCRICLDIGKPTPGALVDHIIPLDEGGERLDEKNMQTLCRPCHAKKTHDDKKRSR